jgi:hypothetical protein
MNEELLRIIELFDEDEVTTADKIDRPERALEREAIDDFMKRNPMAGGGMLVQPSADGSRPEYGAAKGSGIKLTAEEIKKIKENLSEEDFKKLDFDRTGVKADQKNYGVGQRQNY